MRRLAALFTLVPTLSAAEGPEPAPPATGLRWSVGVVAGAGGTGAGAGFTATVGGRLSRTVRLEVFGDATVSMEQQAGYDVGVGRGTIGLAVALATASGVEPWAGLGVGVSSASATREEDVACVEGLGCASVDLEGGSARGSGPVLAAGVRVPLGDRLLFLLDLRKPLIPSKPLDGPPGTAVELGGAFVSVGLAIRTRG